MKKSTKKKVRTKAAAARKAVRDLSSRKSVKGSWSWGRKDPSLQDFH